MRRIVRRFSLSKRAAMFSPLAGVVLVHGAAVSDCRAADRSWSNTAGGTFTTAANWQDGLVAGVNDVACFRNSSVIFPPGQASYTISFAGNAQTQAVKVRNDLVTFDLGGRTYTTTQTIGNEIGTVSGGGSILVARNARLTILNGTFNVSGTITPQILVGAVTGSVGSLTLGTGAILTGSPNLFVGTASAVGSLTINGGTATVSTLSFGSGAGGAGTGVIAGPFAGLTSSRLFVGDAGSGTMSMTIGAVVQNNGTATIGNAVNSSGLVNVDGATVRWDQNGSLLIGNSGAGSVNVLNGASLNGAAAILGNNGAGVGALSITGGNSRARLTDLTVGNAGVGSLTVSGGGSLNCTGSFTTIGGNGAGFVDVHSGGTWSTDGTATLAGAALSTARVNVSGTGSKWDNSGRLSIGALGTATLHVSDGADVTSTGTTTIAANGEAFVRVEGAGASFVVFGTCSIGSGGTATFDVLDGAFLQTRDATVGAGSNNTAVVTVSGQNSNWTLTDNGTPRNLTIGGSGTLAADATLNIINGGDVICGQSALRHGTAIVDGDSSRWISSQSLGIGDTSGNPGSLTIRAAGRVESSSGGLFSGAVEVSGANSLWVMTGDLSVGAVASASLQIHSGGSVQSANTLIAGSTGPSSIGTVTVQAGTWSNSGSVYVGGNFTQAGGQGSLDINPGGFVSIAESLVIWNNGTATLAGGQLNLGSIDFRGSTFNFNAGTLRFTDVVNFDAFFVEKLLGASRTLGPNRSLIITSTPTLSSLLILGGGMLTVPQLAVGSPLQFDSGTFNLTSANLTIGNTGLFGDTVVLDTRNINVTNSTNIQPGGRLFMLGGHFSSGRGITNNGEIIVNSPFTADFGNPIINNAEIRVATGASAHFFANVTGAGSITGGGAKVFEPGGSSSASRITGGGSTIVRAGASLSIDVIRDGSLLVEGSAQIRPNAENSRVSALSIPAGGRLDLTSNTLIGDYTGASPFNSIRALLASGFDNGSWNGAGISSSVAAAQPNRALGFAEAGDIGSPATFAGEPIDPTTLLIRFTLPGDANLDRLVNIGDFSLLAASFNQPSYWARGDFNYDGVTAIGDFALLAANFNQLLPGDAAARGVVPEPAAFCALAAGWLAWLHRRSRRLHLR